MMDTDGDGSISAGEHAAGAGGMFMAMDANDDGNVERGRDARQPARAARRPARVPGRQDQGHRWQCRRRALSATSTMPARRAMFAHGRRPGRPPEPGRAAGRPRPPARRLTSPEAGAAAQPRSQPGVDSVACRIRLRTWRRQRSCPGATEDAAGRGAMLAGILAQVSREALQGEGLDAVLQRIVDCLVRRLPVAIASIILLDDAGTAFRAGSLGRRTRPRPARARDRLAGDDGRGRPLRAHRAGAADRRRRARSGLRRRQPRGAFRIPGADPPSRAPARRAQHREHARGFLHRRALRGVRCDRRPDRRRDPPGAHGRRTGGRQPQARSSCR